MSIYKRGPLAATPPQMRVNACKFCRSPLDRSRPWQEFCRDQCRYQWNNERRRAETKRPPADGVSAEGEMAKQKQRSDDHPTAIRTGTKLHAEASALCRGEKFDCFEAVVRFHDYVARSTISELANRYGVKIIRTPKVVPGYAGSQVHCVEYSVDEEGATQLAKLLGWPVCQSST